MTLDYYMNHQGMAGISGLIFACGSFGIIDGECNYTRFKEDERVIYRYENETIALVAEFTLFDNGVVIRRDRLENHSDNPIEINGLSSRFFMDGSSYEVYTQYSAWQHESQGSWQKLVTQVTAASQGIRTCDGAAPMMALHNLYTGKNTVFHLLPNAQWEMTVRKFPINDKENVILETGFRDKNLRLTAAAGEQIDLPAIIFFTAQNKTDLDAYKLHETYNRLYPRKKMPVVYNSWLYCFDNLDIDSLLKQIDCAAELGFEAFMIDAGWFGEGKNWSISVGDWKENMVSGPKGRLNEISRHVRELGMIFGLWFEPERAHPESKAVNEHPDYYINEKLLDFSNPDAVDYMVEIISEQIEKYSIGWLKFDFNDTIPLDPSGNAFYRYMQGQRRFVEAIRNRFPDIYLTNCASGGYRMELCQGTFSDSFWLSDNQGPYEGIRIVKDTLKRMPTALIERWNVQKYSEGFPRCGYTENVGVMFSCNNATWDFIINVDDSFTEGFLTGGPVGFSCDIADFPKKYKERWKELIAKHKQDRDFYMQASARILVDTEDIIVIQYADCDLTRSIIQIFTKTTYADNLIVYPVISEKDRYQTDGRELDGKDIMENGLYVQHLQNNCCRTIELIKK